MFVYSSPGRYLISEVVTKCALNILLLYYGPVLVSCAQRESATVRINSMFYINVYTKQIKQHYYTLHKINKHYPKNVLSVSLKGIILKSHK